MKFPNPFEGMKGKAVIAAAAIPFTAHAQAPAETINSVEQVISVDTNKTLPESTIYPFDEGEFSFNLDSIYENDQERESRDKMFSYWMQWDLPSGAKVDVEYKNPQNPVITVSQYEFDNDGGGKFILNEEYRDLDELKVKYPELAITLDSAITKEYAAYKKESAWRLVFSRVEDTLSNNFEGYEASPELLKLIDDEVALKKAGEVTDGYDEILRYFEKGIKTPEDRLRFYKTHDGTPAALASYLHKKYYIPALEEKE